MIEFNIENILILLFLLFILYNISERCNCIENFAISSQSKCVQTLENNCKNNDNLDDNWDCQTCIDNIDTDVLGKVGCSISTVEYKFCDNYAYIYTFHPDPIINKEDLSNRNWSYGGIYYSSDNTFFGDPCKRFVSNTFSKSYKYLTRLRIQKSILNRTNNKECSISNPCGDKYEHLTDCACISPGGSGRANNKFGILRTADSDKNNGNGIFWISINSEWINNNISDNDFKTIYSDDQKWFDNLSINEFSKILIDININENLYIKNFDNFMNTNFFTNNNF